MLSSESIFFGLKYDVGYITHHINSGAADCLWNAEYHLRLLVASHPGRLHCIFTAVLFQFQIVTTLRTLIPTYF
jgi:hypothetical protein